VSPRETSHSASAGPSNRWAPLFPCAILLALFALFVLLAGCKRLHLTDTTPLDATGMSFSAIEELRKANVTDSEVADLVKAKQGGISDDGCLELVRLGAGELQAMRLAGISEFMILEVARRHAENKPTFSGVSLVDLKNSGFNDSMILELIRRGLSDDQKDPLISLRHRHLTDAAILAKFPAPPADAPPAPAPQP
jgi:hypothetical protein